LRATLILLAKTCTCNFWPIEQVQFGAIRVAGN